MLHTLLRPRAILTHLLVLTVAIVCVVLGNWQLQRLNQVRDNNQLLAQRLEAPPADLAQLALEGGEIDAAELEFRTVEVTGTYRPDEEVLQRNRSHQGRQGFHLLTPLELSDGGVVLVRRGWVPAELSEPPVGRALPPSGEVQVTGVLERPVAQPGFGARDPAEGVLSRVFHTDTARLDQQVEGRLFPMVLRLRSQDPALPTGENALPLAIGAPELDEANHLSYAFQWFTFAALALISYVAWLWTGRRRGDHRSGSSEQSTSELQEPVESPTPPRG